MSIEERYLSGLTAVQFPDAPVAQQTPAEPSLDGVKLAMGGSGAGNGRNDRPMSDAGTALFDTGAGLARGAVAQTLGLPGDLEMLYNGLKGVFTKPEEQTRLGAFFKGMQEKTVMPTTERMGEILPPVVPAGAPDEKNRTHNANIGQAFGEIAPLPGAVEAGVAAAKYGAKTLGPKAAEMAITSMEKLGTPVKIDLMAYHGSPHQVDKFDSKKIGSGEGAQAYGYGLYFAEDKGVAKGYHTSLSMKVAHVDGQVPERNTLEWEAANSIASKGYDEALAQAQKTAEFKFITPEGRQRYQELVNVIEGMKGKKVADKASGGVYTVDIPDEMANKMLDFDKPIGEQSSEIQALAKKYKLSAEDLGGDLLAAARGKTPKGAQIMRDAGIPGVRYLDQGSRGAGDGKRNIVVFHGGEDQIKILKQEGSN